MVQTKKSNASLPVFKKSCDEKLDSNLERPKRYIPGYQSAGGKYQR